MIETKYIAKPRLKEILSHSKYKQLFPSQKDLASAVGVKDPTISRFDSQTRYDINTLISISRELNIRVEDLFAIEENPNFVKPKRQYENEVEYEKNIEQTKEVLGYLLENDLIHLSGIEMKPWRTTTINSNEDEKESNLKEINKLLKEYANYQYDKTSTNWREDKPKSQIKNLEFDNK